jgi:hypothetical protein
MRWQGAFRVGLTLAPSLTLTAQLSGPDPTWGRFRLPFSHRPTQVATSAVFIRAVEGGRA